MGKYDRDNSHAAESSINATGRNERKENRKKGRGSVGIIPHRGRKEHSGQRAATTNVAQEMTDGEDDDKQSIAEKAESVEWHLNDKDTTFAGAYDTTATKGGENTHALLHH